MEQRTAQQESHREMANLVALLLIKGKVRWRRFRLPGESDIREQIDVSDESAIHIPAIVENLRYYRWELQNAPLETGESATPSRRLYRRVALLPAGKGLLRPKRNYDEIPVLTLLPLGTHPDDRVYITPLVKGMAIRRYSQEQNVAPELTARGRSVRATLAGMTDAQEAWIELRIQSQPLAPNLRHYLARINALIAESPDALLEKGNHTISATTEYREILHDNRVCKVEIHASHDHLLYAFLYDTSPMSFARQPPQTNELFFEGIRTTNQDSVNKMIVDLGEIYSVEMAADLISAGVSITFADALTGASHWQPLRFARTDGRRDAMDSGHKSGVDIPLGMMTGNHVVMLDVEHLRYGCAIFGPVGSGKTTLVQSVLTGFKNTGYSAPVQIYDPVGDEYEKWAIEQGVRVYDFAPSHLTASVTGNGGFSFNPFYAPIDATIEQHGRLLANLLAGAFPQTDTGKAFLQEGVIGLFRKKYKMEFPDKNFSPSVYTGKDQLQESNCVPDFQYFLDEFPKYVGQYGESNHYKEAQDFFKQQMNSLRNSLFALVLGGDEPLYSRFEHSFVVSLRRFSDVPEIQATLLNLLLGLNLSYRRFSKKSDKEDKMVALIVVEEAHRIVPAQAEGYAGGGKGSGLSKSAMEILAKQVDDWIREGRKYGVGLILADQSPSEVRRTVVKNVGNLFSLVMPESDDQKILGAALGLTEAESLSLGDLIKYQAYARLKGYSRPILFSMPKI